MKKTIIIIGGGFAGVELAKGLAESDYHVVLVDKQNHHQFQPLFYQVASARLEPSDISFPFRKIFQRSKNITFRMAEVKEILPAEKKIITSSGELSYDYMVMATGCRTNFFGNSQIARHTFSMKSTQEAITIRNEILLSFERYITATADEQTALMNIVIVGAGPTGVELSGAFAEMRKYVLPKDYPHIDFSKLDIILLEGSKHTLNSMSEPAKLASRRYLEQLGVTIRTETFVTEYDGTKLILNSGEQLKSKNVIWAAGVVGNVLKGLDEKESVVKSRFVVDRYNRLKNHSTIFAIGDVAHMITPKYPQGHPQLANVAIHQGKNLARNFLALNKGKALKEYEYRDLGSMATVGKYRGVVDLPWLKFHGVLAWLTWMFLHLMLILGVRNRLIVFINWAWNFFTKDTSLRLIFKTDKLNP